MSAPFEEAMREHSVEVLRRICTVDAPDYTEEARDAARAELVRRGEDVSELKPRVGEPIRGPRHSDKASRLLTLAVVGWFGFGVLSTMLEPLRGLSTVCFLATVILVLRHISR